MQKWTRKTRDFEARILESTLADGEAEFFLTIYNHVEELKVGVWVFDVLSAAVAWAELELDWLED